MAWLAFYSVKLRGVKNLIDKCRSNTGLREPESGNLLPVHVRTAYSISGTDMSLRIGFAIRRTYINPMFT